MTSPAHGAKNANFMKALVYHGPNSLALENRPRPVIVEATDAIVALSCVPTPGMMMTIVRMVDGEWWTGMSPPPPNVGRL